MITGVQQFQLRNEIKTEQAARKCLQTMKDAGFQGIELCAFMLNPLPLGIRLLMRAAGMPAGNGGKYDWKPLLEETGIEVISLHEDLGSVMKRSGEVIAEAKKYKTDFIVITGMHHFDYTSSEEVKKLAEQLNQAGETLEKAGLRLLYHNHNCEFGKMDSGQRAYDCLKQMTDEKYVNFEFDSYWAQDAGANPAEEMRKLGKRMKLYHINDRGQRKKGPQGSILKMDSMELGTGCMPLENLLQIAFENDAEAVVLESHRNWIENSAVRSMELSGRWLREELRNYE